MADKIEIAYIGPKPVKKDTVTGSGLKFPRFEKVSVDSDIAYRLLEHPNVFVRAEDMDKRQKAAEQAEKDAAEKEEAERKAREEEAKRLNFVVLIGDGGNQRSEDLGKMTEAKLNTLVEAEGLEATRVQGDKLDDYRSIIRDELKQKYPQ